MISKRIFGKTKKNLSPFMGTSFECGIDFNGRLKIYEVYRWILCHFQRKELACKETVNTFMVHYMTAVDVVK